MAMHVIIPARYGSSRFPGKPLVEINGHPMIWHVMTRVQKAQGVETVAVATDDDRIKDAVESFGGTVVMTPSELRSGSDRVAAAALKLGLGPEELVVNVQGDQPLLPHQVLDLCAAPLRAEPEVMMTTPVVAIKRPEEVTDPNHVKVVMDAAGNALYFSRSAIPHPRDGNDLTYYKHLGVYIYRADFLQKFAELDDGYLEHLEKLEQLRALEYGHKVRCVIVDYDSPEVDQPKDALRIAELLDVRP